MLEGISACPNITNIFEYNFNLFKFEVANKKFITSYKYYLNYNINRYP